MKPWEWTRAYGVACRVRRMRSTLLPEANGHECRRRRHMHEIRCHSPIGLIPICCFTVAANVDDMRRKTLRALGG